MSAAWAGYDEPRRRHRGRRRRRRLAWIAGGVILAVVVLSLVGGLPRNVLGPRSASALAPGDPGADDPASLAVVVYNAADPLSRDLADFYAGKRGIPADHVVALQCPTTEEISRADYDNTIATPLRAAFDAHHWWERSVDRPGVEPLSTVTSSRVRFLVLMRGIPLRIAGTSNYPGDFCYNQPSPIKDQTAASVDGELAALGLFTRSISGFVPNPNFRSFARYSDNHQPGVMYTGRLDAPTGTMVRRMIEDSIAVEQTGLWGRCYVDARGMAPGSSPLAEGDAWMTKIASEIAPGVLPTVLDTRESQFPVAFPMDAAAMYFGWYSEQPAGPFTREDMHFCPGAVACHIHSFSATSLRDPSRWWVAPLLDRGADAVLGNVYEPYLSLTTHLDIFAQRLADGYTFAEAAWMGTPGLSWMNTVVGDPLYRPGKVWKDLQFDLGGNAVPPGQSTLVTEGRAYCQGALVWRDKGPGAGAAALEKSATRLHSGLIYEGLGGLASGVGDTRRAAKAFEQAGRFYRESGDKVRVLISEVRVLTKAGQKAQADALLADARKRYAATPFAGALAD